MRQGNAARTLHAGKTARSHIMIAVMSASLFAIASLGLLPGAAQAKVGSAGPTHHVYLFRGLINIFSLGIDDIAAKLQQQGYNVSVDNHILWPARAEEAAADYKAGRLSTIVIVGHSAGADAASDMAARLGELGVPVKLVVSLDPGWPTKAVGRVGRYLNYYISDGIGSPLAKDSQYKGRLENYDLKNTDISHVTIEKNARMQQKIIAAVRGAISPVPHRASAPAAANGAVAAVKQ